MNTTLCLSLIQRYTKIAFAHDYIFGFLYKGNVYMAIVTETVLPFLIKLDKASRGAGYAIRFRPAKKEKIALLENATALCSTKYFKELKANSKYNKGEIFEKLVTEYFSQEWKKDNKPFTEDGDITVNKTVYQIKFEKATFCNEKSLANLEK